MSRIPRRLHLCPDCGADFVYPVTWTESSPAEWWLLLRCGACDSWRDVVASNRVVAEFDRVLDAGMDAIRFAAERLREEWRTAEADAFVVALRRNLISADDFRA